MWPADVFILICSSCPKGCSPLLCSLGTVTVAEPFEHTRHACAWNLESVLPPVFQFALFDSRFSNCWYPPPKRATDLLKMFLDTRVLQVPILKYCLRNLSFGSSIESRFFFFASRVNSKNNGVGINLRLIIWICFFEKGRLCYNSARTHCTPDCNF